MLVGWFFDSLRSFIGDFLTNAISIFTEFGTDVQNQKDKKLTFERSRS